MSAVSWAITLSGWVASMLSLAYVIVVEIRRKREKKQWDALTLALERAVTEPVVVGDDGLRSARPVGSQEIRKAIIRTAAAEEHITEARRYLESGVLDENDLMSNVKMLADAGLLEFDEPLTTETMLRLRR